MPGTCGEARLTRMQFFEMCISMFLKTSGKNISKWFFSPLCAALTLLCPGWTLEAMARVPGPLDALGLFQQVTLVSAETKDQSPSSSLLSIAGENLLTIQILAIIGLVIAFIKIRKKTIQRERGRAREKIRERETRLDKILDNVIDGIVTTDKTGTIEIFNPAAERIFGYSVDEVRGKNIDFLMPVSFYENAASLMETFESAESSLTHGIQRELTGLKKDGLTFPMEFSVSEIFLENRRTFTAVVRDISDRKIQEEALKQESALCSASSRCFQRRQ